MAYYGPMNFVVIVDDGGTLTPIGREELETALAVRHTLAAADAINQALHDVLDARAAEAQAGLDL